MLDELSKLKKNSISILELSSFQLQDMDVSPHIAAVLSISPDHLNYHKNMREYLEAKAQLVKNPLQKPQVFQDFSQRDGARLSNSPAGEYAGLEKSGGQAVSKRSLFPLIFFFPDNKFSKQIAQKGKGKKISVLADKSLKLKIPGAHNLKNASMAAAIGHSFGVSEKAIYNTIKNFRGLPHRLEFVREVRGVKFYNDSASTNPGATIAALSSFKEPKILIAGGAGKNLDYAPLRKVIKNSNTRLVILYGQNKKEIGKAIGNAESKSIKMLFSKNLREVINLAVINAKKGDVILLSPASASFDQFSGYDERGNVFKREVNLIRH